MKSYFTADSFGSECPVNWKEICDALNAIAEERGLLDNAECDPEKHDELAKMWEDYCNLEYYPDIPAPKTSWEISLDNGVHFMSAEEAMPEIIEKDMWNVVEAWMDDDTREEVYREDEYSLEDFLRRYLELAPGNLIIG